MDIKDIKEVINLIDKSSISKFEIAKDDFKLVIEKNTVTEFEVKPITQHVERIIENKQTINNEVKVSNDNEYILKSPLVGVFYKASNPESEPFASVGKKVKSGDTLCIIEAMKLMNEIKADVDGEVVEVFLQNEDMVEYGQPLFKIIKN